MFFRMRVACVFRVIAGVRSMACRRVGVMGCFFVDITLMVFRGLTVVTCGFLMMF
jgi:hypothetical protein